MQVKVSEEHATEKNSKGIVFSWYLRAVLHSVFFAGPPCAQVQQQMSLHQPNQKSCSDQLNSQL